MFVILHRHLDSILFILNSYYERNVCLICSSGISFDCKTVGSAIRATDSKNEDIDVYPDTTGGDSSNKGIHGDGGGSNGGGRGDNDGNSGEEEESNINSGKNALSMSQKLTLGYAVLVGGILFIYFVLFFIFCVYLTFYCSLFVITA